MLGELVASRDSIEKIEAKLDKLIKEYDETDAVEALNEPGETIKHTINENDSTLNSTESQENDSNGNCMKTDSALELQTKFETSLKKIRLDLLYMREKLYKLMETIDSIVPGNIFIRLTLCKDENLDLELLDQKQLFTGKIRTYRKKCIVFATATDNNITGVLQKLDKNTPS
ncbi:hypothetical protein BB561_006820 [Smittium simulii]|uniref:Uncharacterized protein n=1 Tax=Smittium simulii TaxID=133385 RepID=A0A2T9Y1B4_9FUNG|nr:hypothetical protein BB561_006820 [Smittium simulii]